MICAELKLWTLVLLGACTFTLGEELALKVAPEPQCEDLHETEATIDPKLDSAFFTATVKSYPWHVIDHGEGRLEDTIDGIIDPEDRIQIEHTADCISDHQGKHTMDFCDASIDGETTILRIWDGLPAYASSLTLKIAADLGVDCSFEASYPSPTHGLGWRITRKTVRLQNRNAKAGELLYGWLSVEFEERSERDGKIVWTPHKIEGHFKPLMRKAAPRTSNSEQDGARQPATRPESKAE